MLGSAFRSSTALLRVAVRRSTLASPSTLARAVSPPRFAQYAALSTETRDKISQAVKGTPLVLFMKGTPEAPQCGFSGAVVRILGVYEVSPEKIRTFNVLEDPELRTAIKEYSEWPTIPQIYVNGEFVGGCDILMDMHQSGELEVLLEKNDVIPTVPDPGAPKS